MTRELSFDIRVEREKGAGETVGYAWFFWGFSGFHLAI